VPHDDFDGRQAWIKNVTASNFLLDLSNRFTQPSGVLTSPQAWAAEEGEAEGRRIFDRLWDNIQAERKAQRTQGNLRGGNPHFVGRTESLRELHRTLALGKVGMVCAVQGLGGMGKTELAIQYAYENAWNYTAGLWQLEAEGRTELLPLLASLASDSTFLDLHGKNGHPLRFTPEEQANSHTQGSRVLQAMLARAHSLRDEEKTAMAAWATRRSLKEVAPCS
jgi:hypothetical protein